jgi:hypothetical protein
MAGSLRALAITLIATSIGLACSSARAEDYDLVIVNGRVMDPESELDAIRNVGVKDGKIAAIEKGAIEGKRSIDAAGHVVAPGFIDTHSHNVPTPLGRKLALRDGVTTPLELEMGVLPVDKWYASMEGKSQTNYGATASFEGAREMVLNPKYETVDGASINDLELARYTHFSMPRKASARRGSQPSTGASWRCTAASPASSLRTTGFWARSSSSAPPRPTAAGSSSST